MAVDGAVHAAGPSAASAGARDALASVELLRSLEPTVLDRLAGLVRHRTWAPGELLVEQGGPGESLIILLSGAATVYHVRTSRPRAALAHLRAPTTLGEVTLFDGVPRSASVEAVEPCEALELRREDLLALLREDPCFLEALLTALGALIRRLSEQCADHLLLDLPGRVARTLVTLAGSDVDPSVIALSQSRIAELAGGSRQSLNQVLRKFAERGLLRVDGREIVVQDLAALRRRAGLPEPSPSKPAAGSELSD